MYRKKEDWQATQKEQASSMACPADLHVSTLL
jgi:hypothetical protein